MSYVPCITAKLTGKYTFKRGLFKPKLCVQVESTYYDTNSAASPMVYVFWRTANNQDMADLFAMPAKMRRLCLLEDVS